MISVTVRLNTYILVISVAVVCQTAQKEGGARSADDAAAVGLHGDRDCETLHGRPHSAIAGSNHDLARCHESNVGLCQAEVAGRQTLLGCDQLLLMLRL